MGKKKTKELSYEQLRKTLYDLAVIKGYHEFNLQLIDKEIKHFGEKIKAIEQPEIDKVEVEPIEAD